MVWKYLTTSHSETTQILIMFAAKNAKTGFKGKIDANLVLLADSRRKQSSQTLPGFEKKPALCRSKINGQSTGSIKVRS